MSILRMGLRVSAAAVLLAGSLVGAAGGGERDVTASLSIDRGVPFYDYVRGETVTDVTVANASPTAFRPPLRLLIEGLPAQGVEAANAAGRSTEGPYFDLEALAPGQSAAPLRVRFSNPGRRRFTFTSRVVTDSAPNSAPVLASIGPKAVAEGDLLVFVASATDPDATTPAVTAAPLPAGATFDGTTFRWTPTSEQAGPYTVTFTASDGQLSASEDVVITVTDVNRAPVLAPIGDRTGREGDLLQFAVSAADPDGTVPTVTADPLPAGATFDGVMFRWTPAAGQAGDYSITFRASDGALTSTKVVAIAVAPRSGNRAPVLAPIGDQSGREGDALRFSVSATDPDGTTPTVTAAPLPVGATFDGTTFRWTPGTGQAGTYPVTFTASDGSLSASRRVTIGVVALGQNRAPVLAPIGDQGGREGEALQFSVSATDPDGTVPTITTGPLPTGATFYGTTLRWTPTFDQAGAYTVTFTASDGQLSGSEVVGITVANVDRAPALASIGNHGGREGDLLQFTVGASDPDGTTPTVTADPLPLGASFDGAGFRWTPTFEQAGTYTLTFTAADGQLSVSEAVTLTIADVDRPPVLGPTADQGGREGDPLQFDVSATDPDGGVPTVKAYPLPAGASFDGMTFRWTPGFDQAGTYTVVFTATEGQANVSLPVRITVAEVYRPPRITLGSLPDARVDQPYRQPVAVADSDLSPLTFALSQGPAGLTVDPVTGVLSWRPAVADIGQHLVTVRVTDDRGGSDTKQYTLSVPDSIPPSVFVTAPKEVIPGATFTVTAEATDNTSVAGVSLEVQGQGRADAAAPPYQRTVTLPATAAIGSTLEVTAEARDPSGNVGRAAVAITLVAAPDTTPPAVTLNAPAQVNPGQKLQLSAFATDAGGVRVVSFSANGQPVAGATPSRPVVGYLVPADAQEGSVLSLRVTAEDFAGNVGSADAQATVAAGQDVVAPTVTPTVPQAVEQGKTLPVVVGAQDVTGVAWVEVYVDHILVATYPAVPAGPVDVPLPPTLQGPMQVLVEVRAADYSGNLTTQAQFVELKPPARGLVVGEVYSAATGLPVARGRVTYEADGAVTAGLTDALGRFSLEVPVGTGRLRATADGFTRVDRPAVAVRADEVTEAQDAWLSPVPSPAAPVSAILGGTVSSAPPASSAAATLAVPPGALSSDQPLGLTTLSAQGLAGPLPPGWSPMGVVDVAPHGIPFAAQALLSAPNVAGVPGGAGLVAAVWDETAGAWVAEGAAALSADGSTISAPVIGTGQHALLLPDRVPQVPPTATAGAQLAGVSPVPVPQGAAAALSPAPQVLFYKPGVRSDVGLALSSPTALPSGTVVRVRVQEEYGLYSGQSLAVDPYVQDVVVYGFGGDGTRLAATWPVTPSRSLEPLALERGLISLDALPPDSSHADAAVGPAGATVTAPTGEEITLPAGAVAALTRVGLRGLGVPDLPLPLPAGFTFLGGATLSLGGGLLAQPASLSVPAPAPGAGQLLLVRIVEVEGGSRYALAAAGRGEGGRVVPTLDLLGDGSVLLPGVLEEGRYLWLQASDLFGFVAGRVTGSLGTPLAGALITADRTPLVALSRGDGTFVAAVPTGDFTLTALDLVSLDSGTALGQVPAPGAVARANLSTAVQPLGIVSVSPAAGAVDVPLFSAAEIRFSKPLDPASVTADRVRLTAASGTAVAGSLGLSAGGTLVTLRPAAALDTAASYTVTVDANLADRSGGTLAAPFSASFQTLDTRPPPAPPAGSVTASIPLNGRTTVTATQGTAGLHDTVKIINVTRNTFVPVLVEPNGSFSAAVDAGLGDVLQLSLSSPAGVETLVALGGFRQTNPDGSVSQAVDGTGGRVTGPGGVVVDVPVGAFSGPAVVTVRPVSEADFPVKLSAQDKQLFGYSGGVDLDLGGAIPQKYLNVAVPTQGGEKAEDQWVVVQVVGGQLNVVDTAHVIDGRVTTSSPPCPGVTGQGVYGFLKSSRPVGLNYGLMYSTAYGGMTARIDVPFLAFAFMPYLALAAEPTPLPVCLPVLSGRVTVSPNAMSLQITGDRLWPGDRELLAKNTTQGTEARFPRMPAVWEFPVSGAVSDGYQVLARPAGGSPVPVPGPRVTEGTAGTVLVKANPDGVTFAASEVIVHNSKTGADTTFPQSLTGADLALGGGAGDTYEVTALDGRGIVRTLPFIVAPAPLGGGNLVARALEGTIDPTQAQIDEYNAAHPGTPIAGPAVDRVTLWNSSTTPPTRHDLPLASIVTGGFRFAFDGGAADSYAIEVHYDDGKVDIQNLPNFRITVTNPVTGRVIKTIVTQAPPRDQPLNLGVITDDKEPPLLLGGPTRLTSFDPVTPLSFTFSEAMDPLSVKAGLIVLDSKGDRVSGQVRISGENRVATFVPDAPFQFARDYSITFVGDDALGAMLFPGQSPIKDRSGNALLTVRLALSTYKPRRLALLERGNDGRFLEPLRDVAVRRKTVGTQETTTVVAVSDTKDSWKLLTFDVTDPEKPAELGHTYGGYYKKRLALLPDARFTIRDFDPAHPLCGMTSADFSGDLAVTSSSNLQDAYVSFFDVRDPANPCFLGNKLLTATPDTLNSYNSQGTVHALGLAGGVDGIKHTAGQAAYMAVGLVGVMAADIGKNLPEYNPGLRVKEGLYPGDYVDVKVFRDRVLAVDKSAQKLTVFDPNLAVLAELSLPDRPRRLTLAEGLGVDKNGDGRIAPDEAYDILFVAGEKGIEAVDVTTVDQPQLVGEIPMPGITRELDVDPVNRRLFAGGDSAAISYSTPLFSLIDISNPFQSGLQDGDGDGFDDRILWKLPYPDGLYGFRVDPDRGLVYIASAKSGPDVRGALDVWAVYTSCTDLSVDLARPSEDKPAGERKSLLLREKEALRQGIAAGLAATSGACGIADIKSSGITILEQGSGACLWAGSNPAASCGTNYQPGLSDHDFEVFYPSSLGATAADCVVKSLVDQFVDPKTEEPVDVKLPDGSSLSFSDITFFSMSREEFEAARLDVEPPHVPGGSDPTGDLGLGRQQLLLKWLLEGYYVDVPGYSLAGRSLDSILGDLKVSTGIPALEGYEWANLQQYNLVKTKAFLRVKGASDPASSFYPAFVKQVHDAGKAGIRASLARMAADSGGNKAVLDVTRQTYASNACVEIDPAAPDPNAWNEKPCTSFEEYVASAAAKTLRGTTPLPLFTRAEVVDQVARFFWLKADRTDRARITADADADAFLSLTSRFLDDVGARTLAVYNGAIGADPDQARRKANLAAAQSKTQKALKETKITVAPRLVSRGFRPARGVEVALYLGEAAGAGVLSKSVREDLDGGATRVLAYERNPDGTPKLDPDGNPIPLFVLGPVDTTTDFGQPHGATFTVDLPEKKLSEPKRDNNLDGFFYYVLDRSGSPPPAGPAKPPLPLPNPGGDLLAPDGGCDEGPRFRVDQQLVVAGAPYPGDVAVGLGDTVTIRLTATNLSGQVVHGVRVCSEITRDCYDVGDLAVGGHWSQDITYTFPTESRILEATAAGYSSDGDLETSAPQRITVACEPYVIAPPEKNPNPDVSQVMRGGKALRYYRVVNKLSGKPRAGAAVKAEVEGFFGSTVQKKPYSFTTDADGMIVSAGEAGMAIPFEPSMVDGTTLFVTIKEIDGLPTYCAPETRFNVDLKDLTYTRSNETGLGLTGSLGVFVGVEGKAKTGLVLKQKEAFSTGPQTLTLTPKLSLSGKTGVEFSLFEVKGSFGVAALKASAGVGMSGTGAEIWADTFEFPYPLGPQANCALAERTLGELWDSSPLTMKLLDLAGKASCSYLQYLKSSSSGVQREAKDEGKFEVGGRVGVTISDQGSTITGEPWTIDKKELGVKFGVSGGAGFGIAADQGLEFGSLVPGAPLGLPVKRTESYTLTGGFDLSAGLTLSGKGTPKERKEDENYVEIVKKGLNVGGTLSSTTVESYGVEFEYGLLKPRPEGKPDAITITYAGPKGFGWKVAYPGGSATNQGAARATKTALTITRSEDVDKAIQNLANLEAIQKTNVSATLGALELGLVPTVLNDELTKLRGIIGDMVLSYQVTETDGKGSAIPLGLEGKLFGIKLGAGLEFKTDSKVTYPVEKGVVVKGATYALEEYSKLPTGDPYIPDPNFGLVDAVKLAWKALFSSFSAADVSEVQTKVDPAKADNLLKSTLTATLHIDGTKEPAGFDAGLFSYHFAEIPGPVREGRYLPSDVSGPAGVPHYGIGGFHHLEPNGYTLAAPTPLVIDYTDAEAAGLDESTLAVYGWNPDTLDWDYVGGTVDSAANTVTVPIQTFRLYTAAPTMPARDISLTRRDDGTSGALDQAVQRFTVTSGQLATNSGQPVADGTLYTVKTVAAGSNLLVPYGAILTADADPSHDGIQVAAHGGQVQFQLEYPASNGLYLPGRAVVYSTRGTAHGDVVLTTGP